VDEGVHGAAVVGRGGLNHGDELGSLTMIRGVVEHPRVVESTKGGIITDVMIDDLRRRIDAPPLRVNRVEIVGVRGEGVIPEIGLTRAFVPVKVAAEPMLGARGALVFRRGRRGARIGGRALGRLALATREHRHRAESAEPTDVHLHPLTSMGRGG
jgi:hypothetical protein